MKTYRIILLAIGIAGLLGLAIANNNGFDNLKTLNQGTSFQDHRDGTYGPVGAGGYGLPDTIKPLQTDTVKDQPAEKKPHFQDFRQGTSFQDHRDGKYGPVGAGGYGSPVPVDTDEPDNRSKSE